jgi:hypothetical protein
MGQIAWFYWRGGPALANDILSDRAYSASRNALPSQKVKTTAKKLCFCG